VNGKDNTCFDWVPRYFSPRLVKTIDIAKQLRTLQENGVEFVYNSKLSTFHDGKSMLPKYQSIKLNFLREHGLYGMFNPRIRFVTDKPADLSQVCELTEHHPNPDYNMELGSGKGGPAVEFRIHAHVDDQIRHQIQIAFEFIKHNRSLPASQKLPYPTLYLLRLNGTRKAFGEVKGDENLKSVQDLKDVFRAKLYARLRQAGIPIPADGYPTNKFKVITEWPHLTQDILELAGVLQRARLATMSRWSGAAAPDVDSSLSYDL